MHSHRRVSSLYTSGMRQPSPSRANQPNHQLAETAVHQDSHVRQPYRTAKPCHRFVRCNPPDVFLWGEVPTAGPTRRALGPPPRFPASPHFGHQVPAPYATSRAHEPNRPAEPTASLTTNAHTAGQPSQTAMQDSHVSRPLQDWWGNHRSGLAAASPTPTVHSNGRAQPPTLFKSSPPCPGEHSRPCAGATFDVQLVRLTACSCARDRGTCVQRRYVKRT